MRLSDSRRGVLRRPSDSVIVPGPEKALLLPGKGCETEGRVDGGEGVQARESASGERGPDMSRL